MSFNELSSIEKDQLKILFSDLKLLFNQDEILVSNIDECIGNLKSSEAKSFINNLAKGTKPETALREAFFAGQSLLSRHLASAMIPEVNTGDGFVDYKMVSGSRFVLLELKPLFDTEIRNAKGKRELIKLKHKKLDWKNHIEQILKYIKQGGEYIVITDLKTWYFFDDTVTPKNCKPFFETDLLSFEDDLVFTENVYDLIERYKYQSIRETLDKQFFEDLKIWIDKLREVEFEVDESEKVKIALAIINKFIFIQTLHDHNIIEFRWLIKRWKNTQELWGKRSDEVLNQFFEDTIKWFFKSYDTELFSTNEFLLIKKDSANISKFYNVFRMILGITYLESDLGGQRGIMQYNFKFIDEDIFGRAYETYLAGVRHELGIYYTPSYVTQFISEKVIIEQIHPLVEKILEALNQHDYDTGLKLINQFTEFKILDPACGSGSFLIKAFRIIWNEYKTIQEKISSLIKEIDVYNTLTRDIKIEKKASKLKELKNSLGFESNRELISKILLRHIFGNDLDSRAVSTAKVNLWLEAIKQSPIDFIYEKLPAHTNRILPYLDMNISNGNAVVGLPDEKVVEFLGKNHQAELSQITNLRNEYILDSTKEELVSKIHNIKQTLNLSLEKEFSKFKSSKKLPNVETTTSLFWPLDFWFAFFDGTHQLSQENKGFDCIIGNPPYVRIQELKKELPEYGEFLANYGYDAATSNYDLAVLFIERGFDLLKKNGGFGYIVTNKFIQGDYGIGIRTKLSKNKSINEIIDFGDQQVFKSATTYTAIIFLKNSKIAKIKYCLVKKLEETLKQLYKINSNDSLEDDDMNIFSVNSDNLSEKPWMFTSSKDEKVLEKIKGTKPLVECSDIFVGLQTSADSIYIVPGTENQNNLEITSKKTNKKYVVEKELFKPILTGKDVKRWNASWRNLWLFFPYDVIKNSTKLISEEKMQSSYPKTWQYLLDHKSFLDEREKGTWANKKNWHAYVYEKNLTMFSNPKIMTGVLANRSNFTLDKEGVFYFVGGGNAGVYGIDVTDKTIPMSYLTGLLNSSFADWLIRKKTSKFHGGYFSYAKRFIDEIPIKIPNKENENLIMEINKFVEEIMNKVQNLKLFYSLWENWSEQMKNIDRTLESILISEEENILDNDNEHLWFKKISFLLSKTKDELKKEYENFDVEISIDDSINIIGIIGSERNIVYSLKCNVESIADHLFLCLTRTISSKLKIITLKDIFEKTIIPVLQPNPNKKTVNIIDKVKTEFENETNQNSEGFVKIEKDVLDLEAKIDASIFKLYGLNKNDINIVMQNLSKLSSYQSLVESYFDKLS